MSLLLSTVTPLLGYGQKFLALQSAILLYCIAGKIPRSNAYLPKEGACPLQRHYVTVFSMFTGQQYYRL